MTEPQLVEEAERAVLGAMLLSPAVAVPRAAAVLRGERDFEKPRHGLIFSAIMALHRAGTAPDTLTVGNALAASGSLTKVGGGPYLHTLISGVPSTTADVGHYALIVRQGANRRRAGALAMDLAKAARGTDPEALSETVARVQEQLAALDDPDREVVGESTHRIKLTRAADIRLRPVWWTWEDRIPAGTIVLMPGREGIGKSLALVWLTARLTCGTLPGIHFGTPRAVFYAATEDSWEHTIAPRLVAAGADLDMVYRVEVEQVMTGTAQPLMLPRDCDLLAGEMKRLGVAMLALDPLMSVIAAGIDTHRDRDLRTALDPLARLADETGAAVTALAHFNKSASADASNLITGSRAFSAVARAVISIARDPDDPDGACIVSQTKNNLGRLDLPNLTYVIDAVTVETSEGDAHVGRLRFTGETERSVSDVLGSATTGDPEERQDRADAVAWLKSYLVDNGGEADAVDVFKAGEKVGFSKDALKRAKPKAHVKSEKGAFDTGWTWRFDLEERTKGAKDAPS